MTHQTDILDHFVRWLGNAVTDVREKVVEEPYFGRVVTGNIPEEAPQPVPMNVPSGGSEADVREVPRRPGPASPVPTEIDIEPER